MDFNGRAIYGLVSAALIALVASFVVAELSKPPTSSTLYCTHIPHTHITTLNSSSPKAKCFRIENGMFKEILSEPPRDEHYVRLDGYVIPGIIESHGHILQYGEMLESVSLYGVESIGEIKERVKEWLGRHEGEGYGTREKWVRGIGWDQGSWGGVYPTAKELAEDPELADLYIMLDRVDVHCVLTSQKVLDLLSDPLPEAPAGGVVVTDPGPGVFCDNAMDYLIYPLAPQPTVVQKTNWFKTAMMELNKVGIIGMGDAGMRADDVMILEDMAGKGGLTVRMNVMLECAERNTYCPEETRTLKLVDSSRDELGDSMLILGGVKLFADGALGSWGAALLEPYSDKPETSGTMLINETELTKVVKNWFEGGFQVNIHAIGDRANRAAVDAFEYVLGPDCNGCNSAHRLRIEHAQIIHPDDQVRIAKMGIIPSIQPTHATSDMTYALARLGTERIDKSAYRMRSLFPSSASRENGYLGPVLGSDFPVEPPNPFHGMYAAVTRLNPATGTSPSGPSGWHTEEALSIEQAFLGFTRNAAYGWKKEDQAGAIEAGKWADWLVIDKDVLAVTGKELRDVVVKETWVGGKRVWPLPSGKEVRAQGEESLMDLIEEAWGFLKSLGKGQVREDL